MILGDIEISQVAESKAAMRERGGCVRKTLHLHVVRDLLVCIHAWGIFSLLPIFCLPLYTQVFPKGCFGEHYLFEVLTGIKGRRKTFSEVQEVWKALG